MYVECLHIFVVFETSGMKRQRTFTFFELVRISIMRNIESMLILNIIGIFLFFSFYLQVSTDLKDTKFVIIFL